MGFCGPSEGVGMELPVGMPGIPQCTPWWFPWLPGCSRASEGVGSAPTNVGYTVMLLFLTDCKNLRNGQMTKLMNKSFKSPKSYKLSPPMS